MPFGTRGNHNLESALLNESLALKELTSEVKNLRDSGPKSITADEFRKLLQELRAAILMLKDTSKQTVAELVKVIESYE